MLVTSYFARAEELQSKGFKCVSIANSQPKNCNFPVFKAVVPPWEIVEAYKKGNIDWEQYTEKYNNLVLSYRNPEDVTEFIHHNFGDNVAFLGVSLIDISEPSRLMSISYADLC